MMKKLKAHLSKVKDVRIKMSKNIHPKVKKFKPQDVVNIKKFYGHLISLFILSSLLCLFITAGVLLILAKSYEESVIKSREIAKQYYYWKEITVKHPNFPDGFLQAARYAKLLGENEEALGLVEKAIMIDPNSTNATDLKRKILEKR